MAMISPLATPHDFESFVNPGEERWNSREGAEITTVVVHHMAKSILMMSLRFGENGRLRRIMALDRAGKYVRMLARKRELGTHERRILIRSGLNVVMLRKRRIGRLVKRRLIRL